MDAFVVMPNHIHGILILTQNATENDLDIADILNTVDTANIVDAMNTVDNVNTVETLHATSLLRLLKKMLSLQQMK